MCDEATDSYAFIVKWTVCERVLVWGGVGVGSASLAAGTGGLAAVGVRCDARTHNARVFLAFPQVESAH